MKRIYYLVLAIILLIANYCSAAPPRFDRLPTAHTVIYGRAYTISPYFVPNPNYEPIYPGFGEFIENEFYRPNAKLAAPPRRLLDIVTPGTLTRVKPYKGYDGPAPTIGR